MSELKSWGHDGSSPKCGACEEYNGLAARLISPAKGEWERSAAERREEEKK